MFVKVTIRGITPLLMHRFNETSEVAVGSGTSSTMRGSKGTPREQAESFLYQDVKTGDLYFPGTNVFSCIMWAGIFHKIGRRTVTTQKSSLVPAGVSVMDLICSFKTKHWEVDARSVVIPTTGGRVMCYRPRLDQWQLTFTLDIDTSVFHPDLVRALVDDGGKKVGLGDWRPQRRGTFGKFVVIEWKEIKEPIVNVA